MIQDISPHNFNISYQPKHPATSSKIFIYSNEHFLLQATGVEELLLPTYGELPECLKGQQFLYLFSVDGTSIFLLLLDKETFLNLGYHQYPIHAIIGQKPVWMPLVVVTAAQLARWYINHRYCGCCGSLMEHDGVERSLICNHCGHIEYPQIAPVVIVAVIHEGRLLMTHYAGRNIKPYVLIAGFVEIGETLEDAAKREVLEEVGLHISELRYFGNQPWGISDSLAIGFFAKVTGQTDIILDHHELADAAWFSPEQLPLELDSTSLTAAMIDAFRKGTASINYQPFLSKY